MKRVRFNILAILLFWALLCLLPACEDSSDTPKTVKSDVVNKKIAAPKPVKAKPGKTATDAERKAAQRLAAKKKSKPQSVKKEEPIPKEKKKKDILAMLEASDSPVVEHYNAAGKIDPFKPLIQNRTETKVVRKERPKRILTPLEKVDLSQIRLVAVIDIPGKNTKIAMVEEASGKGYEVGVGTYIGKNQGRIAQIKKTSIVVKELVEDFKGRLREKTQEIKLHNFSDEE